MYRQYILHSSRSLHFCSLGSLGSFSCHLLTPFTHFCNVSPERHGAWPYCAWMCITHWMYITAATQWYHFSFVFLKYYDFNRNVYTSIRYFTRIMFEEYPLHLLIISKIKRVVKMYEEVVLALWKCYTAMMIWNTQLL